eukprot:1169605-Prymnesium_polylepis.1
MERARHAAADSANEALCAVMCSRSMASICERGERGHRLPAARARGGVGRDGVGRGQGGARP